MPNSNMESVDKLLTADGWKYWFELNGYRKESQFTMPMMSPDQAKSWDSISEGNAHDLQVELKRREERIKVEAELSGLENNAEGLSKDIWYTNKRMAELRQQLKTLDGQENTNGSS